MSSDLQGKVALVTGGGRGIGAAIVQRLCDQGVHVAFTDLAQSDSEPNGSFFIRADATVESDAAAALADVEMRFGRLDILVNNVGNFGAGDRLDVPLESTPLDAWDATMKQCLTSCMLGMKYAIPALRRAGGGAIVNIASLAGIRVTRFASPAYTAAKAAVVHLSEQLAVLHAPENIRINVVAPGLTLTPNIAETLSPESQQAIASEFQPMGRLVTPAEVADAVIWAASPRASGVTGLVIPVDGGWAAK